MLRMRFPSREAPLPGITAAWKRRHVTSACGCQSPDTRRGRVGGEDFGRPAPVPRRIRARASPTCARGDSCLRQGRPRRGPLEYFDDPDRCFERSTLALAAQCHAKTALRSCWVISPVHLPWDDGDTHRSWPHCRGSSLRVEVITRSTWFAASRENVPENQRSRKAGKGQ